MKNATERNTAETLPIAESNSVLTAAARQREEACWDSVRRAECGVGTNPKAEVLLKFVNTVLLNTKIETNDFAQRNALALHFNPLLNDSRIPSISFFPK